MTLWDGNPVRDLIPEMYPDEVLVVSLFEEGPCDNGTRALCSWFVRTSAELKMLCDALDELIATDLQNRPEEATNYPLTYSTTLVPKAESLEPESIRIAFREALKPFGI